MNKINLENYFCRVGKTLLLLLSILMISLNSKVAAQNKYINLNLVDDSGLDESVATVWVGGYTQLYDDGRCGVLQSDGTFAIPSIKSQVSNYGGYAGNTYYYYEFEFFKVSDIPKIRLDEPPTGKNLGNQRLYFVISKDKPSPIHTTLTTDSAGQWGWDTYSSNPLTTIGYDYFGNSMMAPGPYDIFEFGYDAQFDTSQVNGLGLNWRFRADYAKSSDKLPNSTWEEYGVNGNISRKQIGSAFKAFIANEAQNILNTEPNAEPKPDAKDWEVLLFNSTLGSGTDAWTPPLIDGQFFYICDPADYLGNILTATWTKDTTNQMATWLDDAVNEFYTEGNYLSINLSSGTPKIYTGKCTVMIPPAKFGIGYEVPTFVLYLQDANGNIGDPLYFPKPIPAASADPGKLAAWLIFGNNYGAYGSTGKTFAFADGNANDEGLINDNIWQAFNRGVAVDGIGDKDIAAGHSTTKWNDDTKWYNQFDKKHNYNLFAKFCHYSDIDGKDSRTSGKPSIFIDNCAYGFGEDENPDGPRPNEDNVPPKTILSPTAGDYVTLTLGPYSETPTSYTLTMEADPKGFATLSPASGGTHNAGTQVSLSTSNIKPGYHFVHWEIIVAGTGNINYYNGSGENNAYTLTMNGNTTATAILELNKTEAKVSLVDNPNGSLSIEPKGTYYVGQNITVTATPNFHYHFSQFQFKADGNNTKSTNNPCSLNLTGDTTISASFDLSKKQATVNIIENDNGSISVSPDKPYAVGQLITITATPNDNYQFERFYITSGSSKPVILPDNPQTYKLTQETTTIAAKFSEVAPTVALTMAVSPKGVATTNPVEGGNYKEGSKVDLTATATNANYHFKHWLLAIGSASPITQHGSGTNNECKLTITGATTATAVFEKNETAAKVTVTPNDNGTVTISPSSGPYYVGQSITATATANDNYQFSHFEISAGGNKTVSKANPLTFNLTGDTTITVVYNETENTATLTMAVSPTDAGTVTSSQTVNQGEPVPIEVLYIANGYKFLRWTCERYASINDVSSESTFVTVTNDLATVTGEFSRYKPDNISVGSVIELTASELRITDDDFSKKPKIMVTYDDKSSGKNGTENLRVVTKVNKKSTTSQVYAEWTKNIPLFDKKDYRDKSKSMYEILAENPMNSLVTGKLTVMDKEISKSDFTLNRVLHLIPPSISQITGKFTEGETFKVIGKFFGAKPPEIFLEYTVTKNGRTEYKLKKCKIVKKNADGSSTLLFKDARGRTGKSCMKVWYDDIVYTNEPKAVGYSEVTVEYPKINSEKMKLNGYLVLNNKIAITTAKIPE